MTGSAFNRRTTLAMLSAGAAALALDISPAFGQAVRVRQDITALSAAHLASLKNGVSVMKTRSASNQNDPTGWYYWSAAHGTDMAVPPALASIYNQCKHHTSHFIDWHRAYLFFFEQTLRAASGDTTLNLPYWDWYNTPTIPADFTSPANTTNPLWNARPNTTVTGLSQAAFANTILNLVAPPSPAFASSIEQPHDSVHGQIGGDMGAVQRSARDPIFYLHHCNIDRMWNVWLKMAAGRVNPAAGDPWLTAATFQFDTGGSMSKQPGGVIDSVALLNYKYDRDTLTKPRFPWWVYALDWRLVALARPRPLPWVRLAEAHPMMEMAMAQRATFTQTVSTLEKKQLALGSRSARIVFPLAAPDQQRLSLFAARPRNAPSEISDVTLVLEGVQLSAQGANGGFSYAVCIALPDGQVDQATFDRRCVGTLNSFTLSVEAQHAGSNRTPGKGGYTVRMPLGAGFDGLKADQFREGVPVTFLAQHEPLDKGKGPRTYITIQGAHLEFEQQR